MQHFAAPAEPKVAIIGLGYVGLPLAVALAEGGPVIGYDISGTRISELRDGHDRTREIEPEDLKASSLVVTNDAADLKGFDVYIVTVPTPITSDNRPNLSALEAASDAVGRVIAAGAVVVFESTVYPGVTEDVCGPILADRSGLTIGKDLFLGYSPERINPGDKVHTVDKITKVVAGQTSEVGAFLAKLYGRMNNNNIHLAPDIRTAEAAKVIENAQRDINIAFVNEVASICMKLGISVYDVLEAARTKWNFLPFSPGLVGGHCIGVDPYYLSHLAEKIGLEPQVILAGRRTNDTMAARLAGSIRLALDTRRTGTEPAKILVLGITFKEDVPDLRNTKVVDLIDALSVVGATVDVHDPQASAAEAETYYGVNLLDEVPTDGRYDAVVLAVAHAEYCAWSAADIAAIVRPDGLVADIKNAWRTHIFPEGLGVWKI